VTSIAISALVVGLVLFLMAVAMGDVKNTQKPAIVSYVNFRSSARLCENGGLGGLKI